LAGVLRPGNAGANTAIDQITAEMALQQIPRGHIADIEVLLRVDGAGASKDPWRGRMRATSTLHRWVRPHREGPRRDP
jgi:hypothetical protein